MRKSFFRAGARLGAGQGRVLGMCEIFWGRGKARKGIRDMRISLWCRSKIRSRPRKCIGMCESFLLGQEQG
jgi:hypothetical protein